MLCNAERYDFPVKLDLDRPNRQQNYKAVSRTGEKVAAHYIEHRKTFHRGLVCFGMMGGWVKDTLACSTKRGRNENVH